MQQSELAFLLAYNRWANERILAAARPLTPAQLTQPARVSFGSLLGTLAHILGTEITWRTRLQEGSSPTLILGEADFPSLADLERRWQLEMERMAHFIGGLSDQDANRWVEYTTTSGKAQGSTLWRALAHLVNHGTQFRAEAGVVLTLLDRSPGDIDLLLFERETDQR